MKKITKTRNENLTEGPVGRTLRRMTVPMILGMVMMMSFGLVDTFFVSLLGTDQLAAISFTFPVTFTVISLNIGLGIGTSAIIGKLLGAGAQKDAKLHATGSLMLSVILVSALAAAGYLLIDPIFHLLNASDNLLPYIRDYMSVWYLSSVFLSLPMVGNSVLRACGDTRTPSIIMASGGALNAAMDPIFIFGFGPVPAMGIQGAAVATFVAWLFGAAWIIWLLAVRRELMVPRLLTMSEFKESARDVLKIGLPAAGANMLTPIAGAVMTALVATYGAEAVAAWGVGNRLESIASIIILALSMTLPPLISQNVGANLHERVEAAYKITLKFIIVWQLIVYLLLWVLSDWIAAIFANEKEVAELITLFLAIVPLGYGMQGVVILTNSSFNAMHMPMTALVLSIIRLFVLFVPVSYAGSLLFNIPGLFWGNVVANILMAVISFISFKRALIRQKAKSVASEEEVTL